MRPIHFAALLAALTLFPSLAHADRVVLYPLSGRAEETRRDELEELLAETLRALDHSVLAPPGGLRPGQELPTTSAELNGVATAAGADYVVLAEMEPLPGQYRLHLRVGYQPTARVEELVVTVLDAEEDERIRDVLAAMIRESGLGEDAIRLTGVDPEETEEERTAREERERLAAEEAARAAAEQQAAADAEAQQAQEEAEAEAERERAEAEAEAERERQAQEAEEQAAWEARKLYGADGPWAILGGVSGGYALGFSSRTVVNAMGMPETRDTGGGLAMIQGRFARMIPDVDGLEVRAGVDVILGLTSGMDVVVGASWQATPFLEPIHIGAIVELGASFVFSGAREVGFAGRVSAIVSWTPIDQFQLEFALPELGVLTNGTGALTMGAALRAGYRFE